MTVAKGKSDGAEKKPSQRAMVQAVLDELGFGALPQDIQPVIKSRFGVELPTNVISNYKSQIKREGGSPGRKRGRPGGASLQIEDFEAVRVLVKRLGANQVKRLVDVVS